MGTLYNICFGNEVHGDDGFGIRVFSALCELAWPKNVKVFNAGIAGLSALRFLEDCIEAIVLDALTNFGNMGEIYTSRPEDLAVRHQPLTGHALGIPYLLEAPKVMPTPQPDILIVGVEVDAIKPFSLGLSHKTEQSVDGSVEVLRELVSE